ncbi:MAG: hypothetical protein QOI03_97 [Solirubrobacteraceae bacterium]|nr:hypothetical protein [Solirubrobacteraceae bacterium]
MRTLVGASTFFSCESCQQSSELEALILRMPRAEPFGAPLGEPSVPDSLTLYVPISLVAAFRFPSRLEPGVGSPWWQTL